MSGSRTAIAIIAWFLLGVVGGTAQAGADRDLDDLVFSEIERQVIKRYFHSHYSREHGREHDDDRSRHDGGKNKGKGAHKGKGKGGSPHGLAKRQTLPPGLAKRQTLPPGLERRALPNELLRDLPATDHRVKRVIVDHSVVLVEVATNRVLDILEDVLLGHDH